MEPTALIQKVRATVLDEGMIDPGDRVLAAVSGGPDSVALVHILHTLSGDLGFHLHVAHLNHQIRGSESDEDAAFVARLAESLRLPLVSKSLGDRLARRLKDRSLEEAARLVRYEFLEDAALRVNAGKIATGHTADDQAETVLMRMIQGTGPGGLAGIRPVRGGRVIRPLIRCRAHEIAAYLRAVGIRAREDSSNRDTTFLRNRIRLSLLPLLEKEFNPGIVEALCRLASLEGEVDRHLRRLAAEALEGTARRREGKIWLALDRFGEYDGVLQMYVLRAAIEEMLGRLTDVSYEHVQALMRLARRAETPYKRVTLPGSLHAHLESGFLVLGHPDPLVDRSPQEISVPGVTRVPAFGLEIHTALLSPAEAETSGATAPGEALFDWDELRPPVRVRGWSRGDRFRPSGMRGSKKLQDFFTDEKVPRSVRDRTALLVDQDAIHWVVGYRTSELSRVREGTRRVLKVRASPLTG